MEITKEMDRNPDSRFQQDGEASPKTGYNLSTSCEVN